METHVSYNGNRLIPSPFINITKNYAKDGAGINIGSTFTLNIRGTVLAYMGSPDSNGVFWSISGYPPDQVVSADSRLASIERKIEAIRKLFSTEGLQLEIQSADGSPAIKCNPRIISIDFEQDLWYNHFNYAIDLECDVLYGDGSVGLNEDAFAHYISDATENWSMESNNVPQGVGNPRTFILTHTVSATGKSFYNSAGSLVQPAWQNARDFVYSKLGFDSSIVSQSIYDISSFGRYNHARSITYDENAGTYSVTETWTAAPANYTEDFTVTASASAESGLNTVRIEGSIQGLEVRTPVTTGTPTVTSTAYTTANTAWTTVGGLLLTRAQNFSGITLNTLPISASVGKNPITGTITYSYEYNDGPSHYISGALSEVIVVTDKWDVNIFAPITILGRTIGPILQDIGTHRELIRELNIELVMPRATGTLAAIFAAKPDVSAIVTAANPGNYPVTSNFVSDQSETWEPKTGRYTYNAQWTYENAALIATAGLRGNA